MVFFAHRFDVFLSIYQITTLFLAFDDATCSPSFFCIIILGTLAYYKTRESEGSKQILSDLLSIFSI